MGRCDTVAAAHLRAQQVIVLVEGGRRAFIWSQQTKFDGVPLLSTQLRNGNWIAASAQTGSTAWAMAREPIACRAALLVAESFHRAYPCTTQQAFLEAYELALARFAGVFHTLCYNNLTSGVCRCLRGADGSAARISPSNGITDPVADVRAACK